MCINKNKIISTNVEPFSENSCWGPDSEILSKPLHDNNKLLQEGETEHTQGYFGSVFGVAPWEDSLSSMLNPMMPSEVAVKSVPHQSLPSLVGLFRLREVKWK